MMELISGAGGWLVGVGVVIAAFIGAYFKGRSGGRQDERNEQQAKVNQQGAAAREKVRNVEDQIESMDDAAVRAAADRWVQHDDTGKGRD